VDTRATPPATIFWRLMTQRGAQPSDAPCSGAARRRTGRQHCPRDCRAELLESQLRAAETK
jgi:hypothetical protein